MSDTELYLSSGPDLPGLLIGLAEIALFIAACWVLVHPHTTWTYVRLVLRRGRTYRRSLRNARHARPSLRSIR